MVLDSGNEATTDPQRDIDEINQRNVEKSQKTMTTDLTDPENEFGVHENDRMKDPKIHLLTSFPTFLMVLKEVSQKRNNDDGGTGEKRYLSKRFQ